MMNRKPRQRGSGELSSAPANNYTILSFVVLVAFLKRRLCTQWSDALKTFMNNKRDMSGMTDFVEELETQMHLFGLYSGFQFSAKALEDGANVVRQPTRGVLALVDPPVVTCVVLTVPRQRLRPLYEKCITSMRNGDYAFHLRVYKLPKLYAVYSALIPLFGKLITSADGGTCQIESDEAGWHGSSDLHICVYVPTFSLQTGDTQHISLNVSAGRDASQFRGDYGSELEIFKSPFDDASKIQLVKSVPGHPIPNPLPIPSLDERKSDSVGATIAVSNLRLSADAPLVMSTRIDFLSDPDRHGLLYVSPLDVKQTSPCVITVIFDTIHHACQFPYPVDGTTTRLRITGKPRSKPRSIEVVVSPHVPILGSGNAGYMEDPWPLASDIQSNSLCNWNMPFVNFNNLSRIRHTGVELPWYASHLQFMFSEREDEARRYRQISGPMIPFKLALLDVMHCIALFPMTRIPVRFAITHGDINLLFLITGVFLDTSSHNIVAETYVVERTPNTVVGKLGDKVECMDLPIGLEQAQFWKAAVPDMIERCRDWEHGANCEHKKNPAGGVTICSCGKGKSVCEEFLGIEEWAMLAPYVTRCALSPVFPPPYVEQTRSRFVELMARAEGLTDEDIQEAVRVEGTVCRVCGRPESKKKCIRCTKVTYCGRDCLKKDWKIHKRVCQPPK
jgi:MYND finger